VNNIVKSDCRHMARRLAAKEMYNAVSTIVYPDMVLAIGADCVGLKRLKELGIRPLVSDAVRKPPLSSYLNTYIIIIINLKCVVFWFRKKIGS
jgi:hypothetical protein